MLTYSFEERQKETLYEFLYKKIKEDILSGKLRADEKLPSKRALAKHLGISTITVENAYGQLNAEGYIYSRAKSGFYVSDLITQSASTEKLQSFFQDEEKENYLADLADNLPSSELFPFATWTKLMRETMSDNREKLMTVSDSEGIYELRKAIAEYLFEFRNMRVKPSQIVIGAGTEYLYGLIIQLLGRDKLYGIETPGYKKIADIYKSSGVEYAPIAMDKKGVDVSEVRKTKTNVLHISPSHHFPTGIVTPVSRRYELLSWAEEESDRYIIEDEYDSEFRFVGKPIPSLQSIDEKGKVIYINTFSKSLTPTIRISYMILPENLIEEYKKKLSFYSCTVSNFEQYTLAAFISRGYFEKHINRTRNFYKNQRNYIMSVIKSHPAFPKVKIREEDSGLHFLLDIETDLTDTQLKSLANERGINISCLSEYYYDKSCAEQGTVIVNYSALQKENTEKILSLLLETI